MGIETQTKMLFGMGRATNLIHPRARQVRQITLPQKLGQTRTRTSCSLVQTDLVHKYVQGWLKIEPVDTQPLSEWCVL